MKKYLLLFSLITLMISCSKDVSINWISEPAGGVEKSSAEAKFKVNIDAGLFVTAADKITIKWKWQDAYQSGTREVKTETANVSDGDIISTLYYADSGYILLNYYYVEVYDSENNNVGTSSKGFYMSSGYWIKGIGKLMEFKK